MSAVAIIVVVFFVLAGGLGGAAYVVYQGKLRRAKAIERGLKMVPLLIHLPPPSSDTEAGGRDVREVMREKTAQAEVLYNVIAGTATAGFKSTFYGQRHMALELVATDGLVHFYAAVPVNLVSVVEQAVLTAYPGARLEEAEDHNIFSQQGRLSATVGGELVLKANPAYPIATYTTLDRDPLEGLLTTLTGLAKTDGAAVQIMLRPAAPTWVTQATKLTSKLRRGRHQSVAFGVADLAKAAVKAPAPAVPHDLAKGATNPNLSQLELGAIEQIEDKTKHPGFEVLIRILVSAESAARSQQIIQGMATSFALFERPGLNGFKFIPALDIQGLVTAFIFRFFPPGMHDSILNSAELATVFHLPDSQFIPTKNVERQLSKQVDGPVTTATTGLLFGYNEFRGVKKEIRLSVEDRRRHTYILGQTGTGKSTMLENLIVQDMLAGNGFAFIDPHGDAAEKLLSMVPKSRAEDVIYFNPADMNYPLGLNLFEFSDPLQKDFLIQESLSMLYKLYDPNGTGVIGPRFEQWYRNAALTLMADPDGATFIEIPKVFTDTAYLKRKFKYLDDPTVIDFWTKEMSQTSDYHKSEMLGYFVSKFGAFQQNEMMRNIIGQTKSAFNMREIMDNKKILIVNLSKGQVGEMNAKLLGMMFVIKFQAAAMSRADMPEADRADFSLYVDEFQNFSTDSFASILSEARKYRLNLIVANQFIGQLTQEIRDAVFGNIGTIIAHRMGPDDAELMVKQFTPIFDASDLMNLPNFNSAARLMIGGLPSQPFTMADLPPLGATNLELGAAIKQLSAAKFGVARTVVAADIEGRLSGRPVVPAATVQLAPDRPVDVPAVDQPLIQPAAPAPVVPAVPEPAPVAPQPEPVPTPVAREPEPVPVAPAMIVPEPTPAPVAPAPELPPVSTPAAPPMAEVAAVEPAPAPVVPLPEVPAPLPPMPEPAPVVAVPEPLLPVPQPVMPEAPVTVVSSVPQATAAINGSVPPIGAPPIGAPPVEAPVVEQSGMMEPEPIIPPDAMDYAPDPIRQTLGQPVAAVPAMPIAAGAPAPEPPSLLPVASEIAAAAPPIGAPPIDLPSTSAAVPVALPADKATLSIRDITGGTRTPVPDVQLIPTGAEPPLPAAPAAAPVVAPKPVLPYDPALDPMANVPLLGAPPPAIGAMSPMVPAAAAVSAEPEAPAVPAVPAYDPATDPNAAVPLMASDLAPAAPAPVPVLPMPEPVAPVLTWEPEPRSLPAEPEPQLAPLPQPEPPAVAMVEPEPRVLVPEPVKVEAPLPEPPAPVVAVAPDAVAPVATAAEVPMPPAETDDTSWADDGDLPIHFIDPSLEAVMDRPLDGSSPAPVPAPVAPAVPAAPAIVAGTPPPIGAPPVELGAAIAATPAPVAPALPVVAAPAPVPPVQQAPPPVPEVPVVPAPLPEPVAPVAAPVAIADEVAPLMPAPEPSVVVVTPIMPDAPAPVTVEVAEPLPAPVEPVPQQTAEAPIIPVANEPIKIVEPTTETEPTNEIQPDALAVAVASTPDTQPEAAAPGGASPAEVMAHTEAAIDELMSAPLIHKDNVRPRLGDSEADEPGATHDGGRHWVGSGPAASVNDDEDAPADGSSESAGGLSHASMSSGRKVIQPLGPIVPMRDQLLKELVAEAANETASTPSTQTVVGPNGVIEPTKAAVPPALPVMIDMASEDHPVSLQTSDPFASIPVPAPETPAEEPKPEMVPEEVAPVVEAAPVSTPEVTPGASTPLGETEPAPEAVEPVEPPKTETATIAELAAAPPQDDFALPPAESLAAVDVVAAQSAEAAQAPEETPAPAPAEEPAEPKPEQKHKGIRRHGRRHSKPEEAAAPEATPEPRTTAEAAVVPEAAPEVETPAEAPAEALAAEPEPLTGKLILPTANSGAVSGTPASAPAQKRPSKLAKGEVFVDASGNVSIGE